MQFNMQKNVPTCKTICTICLIWNWKRCARAENVKQYVKIYHDTQYAKQSALEYAKYEV